jgi:hypothetical protein
VLQNILNGSSGAFRGVRVCILNDSFLETGIQILKLNAYSVPEADKVGIDQFGENM